MNSDSATYNGFLKWGSRLLWTVAGILLLGLILRLSLKTAFVHNWVKDKVVSTANEQLNGNVQIEKLSGDLWKEISISGLRVNQQQDTLATVDSLHLRYNIWPLMSSKIDISALHIYGPNVNLQQKGEQWNVQQLVPETEDTTTLDWAIDIQDLQLRDGSVWVRSDSLPLSNEFVVAGLSLSSSVDYQEESYSVNLRDLSFELQERNLDEALRVETSASAQNERVTLEKLILATGNSMVQTSAFINSQDTTAKLDLVASPLAWKDLINYAEEMPLRQDLQFTVGLEGTPQQFGLSLDMQAQGLDSLHLSSQFSWDESIAINRVNAEIAHFDPSVFLTDTTIPSLEKMSARFNGNIPLNNYQAGSGDIELSIEEMQYSPYTIDRISGSGELNGGSASMDVEIKKEDQLVTATLHGNQLWTEWPQLTATVSGQHIDPAYWIQDTTYAGNVAFRSELSGQGWYPDKKPWSYSVKISESTLMEQQISGLSLRGDISANNASLNGKLNIQEGVIDFTADVQNMTRIPTFNYQVKSQDVDIAALMGIQGFETSLNGLIWGKGQGNKLENLELSSFVAVDSSLVNGELIRKLSAEVSLRETIAVINNGQLQSSIAEGSLEGRLNVLDIYDLANELSLNLEIKDVESLTPLVDVDTLVAMGEINGDLRPVEGQRLQFTGAFDFSNLRYGNLFSADRAEGALDTRLREGVEYKADITLDAPTFSGINIQDLSLQTEGSYLDSLAQGQFDLQFSSPNEGRIEHAGEYRAVNDSMRVRTTEFNIISDYRVLSLESPFDLTMHADTLRMDTMRVSSGDGAFMELAVPILNSNEQQVFIHGDLLNTAVVQSSLLGKTFFKGMLSARMELSRKDTQLNAEGELLLSDVEYKETSFDSLLVSGNVKDQRLKGNLSIRHDQEQLIDGEADLPFRLGDPENLPPDFFEEDVHGSMRIHEISIDRFISFFEEAGITNTTGIFSFRGQVDGQAGNPHLSGDATLAQATLSGVAVDSLTAGFDYNHDQAKLGLDASVMSFRQKAAEIVAEIPFYINMKTFQVDLPQEEDSIAVDVTTNNFNLAALNDFLDRQTMRNAAGQLNGDVDIRGPLGDLETNGQLTLRKGAIRLVPASILVEKIRSTLEFESDQLRLTEFSANSGSGSMRASGSIAVTDMMPNEMNIKLDAQNFQIANTSQYNAVINSSTEASGSVTEPRLTGNVDFIRGFLSLDNFGEKSVESVQLDDKEDSETSGALYDSLALDMDVSFDRRFVIQNERYLDMEIELDGTLDLLKSKGGDLELFGTMNAPGGYARPFGKEFELREGNVIFSGDPTNPELMIRTQYEPPQTQENVIIWYIIEGTVEDPQFRYESQPPMELENIISYTLFGQPFYALDSWKQVVAGSGNTSATNVALDVLLDRVEALATQKLGIDVVKIENTQSGGESGTQITTGWYLNPRVFLAIQNVITGSTPDTSFLLEYMLRRDLKLMIRQGNGIRQGVDLKWNYDY